MYRLPGGVDCAIKVLPFCPDLDVSLVEAVRRAAHLHMLTDALVDLRSVPLYPAKDSRVIYVESSLTHHLFDIAIR
jgi:hypothetical protein